MCDEQNRDVIICLTRRLRQLYWAKGWQVLTGYSSPITVASLHQKVNVTIVDLDVIAKQIWGLMTCLLQEESIYKAFYLVLFLNINFFSLNRLKWYLEKRKACHSVLKVLYYGLPEMGYLLLLVVLAIKFLFTSIIFSSLSNNGFLQASESCWYYTIESGYLRELGG